MPNWVQVESISSPVGLVWKEARDNWTRGIEWTDEDLDWWDKWKAEKGLATQATQALRKTIAAWAKKHGIELQERSGRPIKIKADLRSRALKLASSLPAGNPLRSQLLSVIKDD